MTEQEQTREPLSTTQMTRLAMRCYAAVEDGEVPAGVTRYRGFLVGEQFFPDEQSVDAYVRFTVEQFMRSYR